MLLSYCDVTNECVLLAPFDVLLFSFAQKISSSDECRMYSTVGCMFYDISLEFLKNGFFSTQSSALIDALISLI